MVKRKNRILFHSFLTRRICAP
ncbi:hypothetical protein RB2654_14435 [Rhodobacterales bacterium HTCC2654]|uniref:Uncharacterized protein n=1 Tax=Maritimibacter alkaliphilus HTCC2654 TaxID=314271 RepID=A3VGT6_9RHOB|nr:hypothetical protein RB2654_14435 [Rhodobacterales bacterium HTCC2654] [Maritimibacter alkaliphilus HTCC2654]